MINDPPRCTLIAAPACSANQDPASCLTPAQVEAARRVYRGLKDPVAGSQIYPGLAPGSEPFWPHRDPANPFPIPIAHYRWLVFADPAWDWKTFQFDDPADYQAHVKAEAKLAPILNATNPDLRQFQGRGGKLLQYHGWNDQLISAQNSIDYYDSVLKFFGSADGSDVARAFTGCSWRQEWRTAPAVPDRTRSTCRRRSKPGSSAASRPIRSSRRDQSTASSIERGRCARIPGRRLQGEG